MIFSVSEANNFIKALLDAVPQLQTIFVRGEISNYKLYPSGHHYFTLKDEDDIYEKAPGAAQAEYIRSIVMGVAEHAPELDGYIAKYAKGWSFDRIPLVASAIMRVAMYESLYRSDIPTRVAVNEAVEIAKKYETPETVKFINGILGSFVRGEISAE